MAASSYSGIGKGRGIATNINELDLIEQVRRRKLLYDKNETQYRKVKKNLFLPIRFHKKN